MDADSVVVIDSVCECGGVVAAGDSVVDDVYRIVSGYGVGNVVSDGVVGGDAGGNGCGEEGAWAADGV